jgi:hypothetical protein
MGRYFLIGFASFKERHDVGHYFGAERHFSS